MTDASPTLSISLRTQQGSGGETVVTAMGELDLATVELVRDELLPAVDRGTVILDLAGVTFCDSSGLRMLVEAHRRAKARGTCLRLAALTTPVRRLLEITRADQVFAVFPDVDSALTDALAQTLT